MTETKFPEDSFLTIDELGVERNPFVLPGRLWSLVSINIPIRYPRGVRSTQPKDFRGCEICHGRYRTLFWPEEIPLICMELKENSEICSEQSVASCVKCSRALCESHLRQHKHSKKIIPDHNHYTGEFRGWLCANCNTQIGLIESVSVPQSTHLSSEEYEKSPHLSYLRTHGSVIFSTFFEAFAGWIDPKYRMSRHRQ